MLIDSNIFLEVLLEQENYMECKGLIKAIKNELFNEKIYLTRFSLNAIEAYCKKKNTKFLTDILLLIYQGKIELSEMDIKDDLMINATRGDMNLDFDDACQFVATQKASTYIVTYDKDFQKVPIEIKTPKQVLKTILKN